MLLLSKILCRVNIVIFWHGLMAAARLDCVSCPKVQLFVHRNLTQKFDTLYHEHL